MGKNTPRPLGICPMCREEKALAQSHIIPRLVFKSMKNLGSGGLVGTQNPDDLAQDGPKPYLLCDECEKIGNSAETRFNNEFYAPLTKGEGGPISYGPWFKRFVVFTTYKSLVNAQRTGKLQFPGMEQHLHTVEEATELFRGFLRDERTDPGPYTHYISVYPKHMSVDDDIPPQAIRALGAAYSEVLITDADEDEPASCFHYILMPQVIIWTYLTPHEMPFPGGYIEQGYPLPDQVADKGTLLLNAPRRVGVHAGIAQRLHQVVEEFQQRERKPQTMERLQRRLQNLPEHFSTSPAARFGQLADSEVIRRGKGKLEE